MCSGKGQPMMEIAARDGYTAGQDGDPASSELRLFE